MLYIWKMSKNLWDKYYQKNQKDWKNKVRERSQNLSKEKKKNLSEEEKEMFEKNIIECK